MCTQNQAIDILKEVYSRCNLILNNRIQDAYLYGSFARGDYHEASDVDILLTADIYQTDIAKYRNKIAEVTSELSLENGITVSVTVKTAEHFSRYAQILPFYKNVVGEGIRYAG